MQNKTKLQFSSVASLPRPEELCTMASVPVARSRLLAARDGSTDGVDLDTVLLLEPLCPSLFIAGRFDTYDVLNGW